MPPPPRSPDVFWDIIFLRMIGEGISPLPYMHMPPPGP
jgi:hypothetical protein